MRKNKKLPSVTLFSKLNIESEHINTLNTTKNYQSTLICLCFHQWLDKKVGTSCPELPTVLKILPLIANHGGTSGWPSTWHNSTDAQIRALDQPLISYGNWFESRRLEKILPKLFKMSLEFEYDLANKLLSMDAFLKHTTTSISMMLLTYQKVILIL